jgi:hypothetical protein
MLNLEFNFRCVAHILALLAVSCAGPARGQTIPATGALNLSLADDSNAPVAGASVSIRKKPERIEHFKASSSVVQHGPNAQALLTSDFNGRLTASTLEPGDYTVCVTTPPDSGIVSPCHWYGVWKMTVAAGLTVAPPSLVLHKGGTLRVHVSDSQHLLPKSESLAMPSFTLGVMTAHGGYTGMKASEKVTSTGRDYTLVIPFDTTLRLWIFSRRFVFADQSTELLNGGNVPLIVSAGQGPKDIYISVIGPAAP